jgi:ribosome biogenesis GTPase A
MKKLLRKEFIFPQENISWFPGHMYKATKEIESTLSKVDIIIEVRDSRIPFSSQNQYLENICKNKNRIILFNKSDLSNMNLEKVINHIINRKYQINSKFLLYLQIQKQVEI